MGFVGALHSLRSFRRRLPWALELAKIVVAKMKIKSARFKNGYKRFFDLTVDLGDDPKRIIALVGPNGCGKSSVLDGLLFHANAHNQIGNRGAKNHEYHSMNSTPNYNYQNVEITLSEGTFADVYTKRQATGKEKTIFSFRSPYRYNSNLKITTSQATSEIRLNNYGASTASDLDDKMEESYRRLYVKFNKYLHEADCTPSQAKAKIINDLNSSLSRCLDLEISSIGSIDASKGTLYFKKPDHPSEFEFNVLSSGEKEVVDILLDIYLRQEEFCDSIFLIDEPELHINSSIQRQLLIEIDRLIGPQCQIWITTHSIGFLRALQEDFRDKCQILQFKPNDNLASRPCVLKSVTPTHSIWREIFAVALDDLTSLICPRQIVYCEGRDEPGRGGVERGMDANALNVIFSKKYPTTLFVSSGGNTELDVRSEIAITLLSKALPLLEVLVLKDRDISSGKSNSEEDRQQYLKLNPQNHRVLKRWEIENYLYDKAVLSAYCNKFGLIFDAAAYDNFVSNIADQNLKDATGRVKNFCNITTSINADKFKLALAEVITEDMEVFNELEGVIFRRE